MDKKGIVAYLLITLILSFAIQLLVLKVPKASLSHLLLFAIPAFAAWAAGRISPASETAPGILWPVPFVRALRISCAIYLCFAVVFTIGAIAGFAKPDWSIGELLMRLPAYNDIRVPEHVKPMLPMAFLLLSFAIMFVIAPTVYAVLLLGVTGLIDDEASIWAALAVDVIALGALGWLAVARWSANLWTRLASALITACFGMIVMVLKVLIHH